MIERIDHLVLTVSDLDATIAFYTDVLGMKEKTFGDGRKALHFGEQKINLHRAGDEFQPHAHRPTPGSADLCFVTSRSLDDVVSNLQDRGVSVVEGPVSRTGAVGTIESVYVRDPDDNLLEIAVYPS
jgi:catechol 2,3-dioxygenase-like lactoylglutathione lyase family enzyme